MRKSSAFTSRCVFVFCLCAVFAGFSLEPVEAQTKPNIMSWGQNVSSWNTSLGINAMREACSIVPTSCEPYLDNLAAEEGAKTYYVSFPLNPSTSVSWAKEYSTLSLAHKEMVEIGFDDFVNGLEDFQAAGTLPNPAAFVSSVIAATKSSNPNLAFGATIYEDSLTHVLLTSMPASVRAQIQYVHLFVHYRMNAPNWASYVATAKSLFPKAKIIAGAYPFDRIDYLPCAYHGPVNCTAAQEQSLYKELLQEQLTTLNAGTVAGLEFYFGYFGDPQDWGGWTGRVCQASRVSQCIANTNTLHNITLQVLEAKAAATTVSPTSINFGSQTMDRSSALKTVTYTNTGTAPITFTTINYTGDFHFSNNCPNTLAAGASCSIWVTFTPTALGARTGNLTVRCTSSGTTMPNEVITLAGTGIN